VTAITIIAIKRLLSNRSIVVFLHAGSSYIPVSLCTACVRILSEEPVDMRATRVICSIRGLASHFAGASIIGAIVGHVTGECL
jgi:hypothetical protein